MSDKKEIRGRWFVLVPMILYSIFMAWSYFPIITYAAVSLLAIVLILVLNVTIYEDYYKPYYYEVQYYENHVKDRRVYNKEVVEESCTTNIARLKAEYDKWKYYYIVFWWQVFYNYIIVPPCNGINYLFNQLVKVCVYVDEKLTVKI